MVFYSIIFDPFSFAEWEAINDKLVIFESCLLIALLALNVSIARIARYHLFYSEGLHSMAFLAPSPSLLCLQCILQNTLEQADLAAIIYFHES